MNIRSINKKLDEIKIILQSLKLNFDCIILSETREIIDQNIFQISLPIFFFILTQNEIKFP